MDERENDSFCQTKLHNSEIYHILSSAYLESPDSELVSQLEQFEIFSNDNISKLRNFNNLGQSQLLNILELKSDYMRLFVGPYKLLAPPWESVYRSANKLVCQESLLEVKEIYREAGLVLDNENLLDDHIGIELEFMSYLDKNNMIELKEKFVKEHLVKWVPDFCNDVIKYAQTSFYKDLALFTKDIVTKEVSITCEVN